MQWVALLIVLQDNNFQEAWLHVRIIQCIWIKFHRIDWMTLDYVTIVHPTAF
jgi:hypothetical protein